MQSMRAFFQKFVEDKRYISSLHNTRATRNNQSYQVLTTRGRTIDRVYYKSAIGAGGFVKFVDWVTLHRSSVLEH